MLDWVPGTGTTRKVRLNSAEVMGHTIRKSISSFAEWSHFLDRHAFLYNWLYRTFNNTTVPSLQETHHLFLGIRSSLQEKFPRGLKLEHYGKFVVGGSSLLSRDTGGLGSTGIGTS